MILSAFSGMTRIKCKERSELKSIEEKLRVSLSNVKPRISKLVMMKQAHA